MLSVYVCLYSHYLCDSVHVYVDVCLYLLVMLVFVGVCLYM